MNIRCLVSCEDSNGKPVFFPCDITMTKAEIDDGDHYVAAREKADDEGYKKMGLVYDEQDGPSVLFKHYFEPRVERNRYLTCIYRRPVANRAYLDIVHDVMTFANPDKVPKALENVLERAKGLAALGYHAVEPVLVTGVGEILNNSYAGHTTPESGANLPSLADACNMTSDALMSYLPPGLVLEVIRIELLRRLNGYDALVEDDRQFKVKTFGFLAATTVCKLYEGLGGGAFNPDAARRLGEMLHEMFLGMKPPAFSPPVEATVKLV